MALARATAQKVIFVYKTTSHLYLLNIVRLYYDTYL